MTGRHDLILAAFRRAPGGRLTPAELAVPDVGGTTWTWELGAMRKRGYDLHENAAGDWFLVGDRHVEAAEAPAGPVDIRAMIADLGERGRRVQGALQPGRARCDPRVASFNSLPGGHEPAIGVAECRCRHCGRPWGDELLTLACVRARAKAA